MQPRLAGNFYRHSLVFLLRSLISSINRRGHTQPALSTTSQLSSGSDPTLTPSGKVIDLFICRRCWSTQANTGRSSPHWTFASTYRLSRALLEHFKSTITTVPVQGPILRLRTRWINTIRAYSLPRALPVQLDGDYILHTAVVHQN